MKIVFRRSGGFAGLRLNTTIDTLSLPQNEAASWQQLVAEAQFFELSPQPLETEVIDGFVYEVTIDTTDQEHSVSCTDDNMPESLEPLLQRLTADARSRPHYPG